jgi:tetratricopeptide (TPR) repeat protein
VPEVFVFVKKNLSGAQRRTRPQAEKGVRGKGRQPFSLPSFERPRRASARRLRGAAFFTHRVVPQPCGKISINIICWAKMIERVTSTLKFSGRTSELETLKARWHLASDVANPSPQVVVIESARGFGKTRLALEFYQWLRENEDGWITKSYWPDALVDLNPDPRKCKTEVEIPYLWWGLHAAAPHAPYRDHVVGDAIASFDRYLVLHLFALLDRANNTKLVLSVAKVLGSAAMEFGASAIHRDAILTVGKAVFDIFEIGLDATNERAREKALTISLSRADAALSNLKKVFKPSTLTYAKTPGVIFLDDAQFLYYDAALPSFIAHLMHNAVAEHWPLLILITHWKAELPGLAESGFSFAGILRHARVGSPAQSGIAADFPGGYLTDDHFVEIDLNPIADLSEALRDKLPGLTEGQSAAILAHMGGNPLFLEQVIKSLFEHPNLFEAFDPTKRLTPKGLDQTLKDTEHQDIFKFTYSRLFQMPEDIKEAICLASMQGIRFVNDLVDVLAKARLGRTIREPLSKGEDPCGMLIGTKVVGEQPIGRFAEPLIHQVAQQLRQTLKSLGGEAALQSTLEQKVAWLVDTYDPVGAKTASTEAMELVYTIAADLFEHSSNSGMRSMAQRALGGLAMLELQRYSFESAAVSYERLLAIERSSDSWNEEQQRIELWEVLAQIYRNLNWPSKAARAFRKVFSEATSIPDGFTIFLRSTDTAAARECFSRWRQEHSELSSDIYIWVVRKVVSALLNLSELARARPGLRIDSGDEPLGDTPFLVFSRPASETEQEEASVDLVPEHLVQAMFLLGRAYAQNGVLGAGQVERQHFLLLEDLSNVADRYHDFAAAEGFLLRAFQITQDLGDELAQIATLSNLGMIAGKRGDSAAADKYLEQARALIEIIFAKDTFLVDVVADDNGTDPEAAKLAAAFSKEWKLKQLAANVYGNLGKRAQQSGLSSDAKDRFLDALRIHEEIGDKENMTTDLQNLGTLARLEGDLATACSHWGRCVEIFRDLERQDAGRPYKRDWGRKIEELRKEMRASGCKPGD